MGGGLIHRGENFVTFGLAVASFWLYSSPTAVDAVWLATLALPAVVVHCRALEEADCPEQTAWFWWFSAGPWHR